MILVIPNTVSLKTISRTNLNLGGGLINLLSTVYIQKAVVMKTSADRFLIIILSYLIMQKFCYPKK